MIEKEKDLSANRGRLSGPDLEAANYWPRFRHKFLSANRFRPVQGSRDRMKTRGSWQQPDFATMADASVSRLCPNMSAFCSPRREYRCSTVSEMPARLTLLLQPQSDEAQLPWLAC